MFIWSARICSIQHGEKRNSSHTDSLRQSIIQQGLKISKDTYPLRSFPNDVMSEEVNNNQTRVAINKQRKAHDSGSNTSDIEHIHFFESNNTVKIDGQVERYYVSR